MPDSRDFLRSSRKALADMARIGRSESSRFIFRITLVASHPSIFGIWISMRITSKVYGLLSLNIFTTSAPSQALVRTAPSMARISIAISALISLSSARRIRTPFSVNASIARVFAGSSASVISVPSFCSCTSAIGRERYTLNSVPFPSSLSTRICPFIRRTMLSAMAIPRPLPP